MPITGANPATAAPVQSVFARTGNVVATAGDYTGVAVGGTADAVAAGALTNAMVNASAAIALSKLADPTTGKVVGSVSNAAAAVYPPGYEWGYTEITSAVTIASSTEATGTTIITCGAFTPDGSALMCEFFTPGVSSGTGATEIVVISLFEGATQIGRLAAVRSVNTTTNPIIPVVAKRRFTPTNASHTYTVTAFATALTGSPNVDAGAGGTATSFPAYCRFTKV